MSNLDPMIAQIEADGRALTEEEVAEVDLWRQGRALAQLVGFEGWNVVKNMLKSYADEATQRLIQVDPSSREEILASHAIAFAANRIYILLLQDIQNAIEAAQTTPAVVGSIRHSPTPAGSL